MTNFLKKLSEVPIRDIRIGDHCISANGIPGIITKIIAQKYASQSEDNEIQIDWENGNISYQWHFQMNHIEYVGWSLNAA